MSWLQLTRLQRGEDAAWLAMRLYAGGFLIWGVWDNVTSPTRMQEFAEFLAGLNCPLPTIAAPVSVWAQLLVGILIIPGLLTRFAGLLLAVNFAVAVVLLGGSGANSRDLFGPMMMLLTGVLLATRGAGALSVDDRILNRRAPR